MFLICAHIVLNKFVKNKINIITKNINNKLNKSNVNVISKSEHNKVHPEKGGTRRCGKGYSWSKQSKSCIKLK